MGNDSFFDERVIRMFDHEKKMEAGKRDEIPPDERTIYSGIKIMGRWMDFEPRRIPVSEITIMLPEEFTEMDPETAKIKYPMEQRPQTILTDASGTANFLFSLMDAKITDDDAEMVRDRMLTTLTRLNPGIRPQSTGKETISGKNVAYVEFSNPVIDGKLYNLMFFLELDGKVLMGSFNCLTKSMKYWRNPAFEMMRSINMPDPKERVTDEL